MFLRTSFTMTAALLASAAFMTAQEPVFEGRDENGDGTISRNEWRGNMRDFRSQDTNRDGMLSGNELPASMRRPAREAGRARNAVDKLDTNNNGTVDGYEWPYSSEVFTTLDSNRDQNLTAEELRNMQNVGIEQLDRNRNRRIDAEEWPGGYAQFDKLDQNGDGKISAQEYYQRGGEYQRRSRFDMWDTNRDGRVSSSEWKSTTPLFRRLDTDRDNVLSWDEFMANEDRYLTPDAWR